MPNLINKEKLIKALKARKERIITNNAARVKNYTKEFEAYKKDILADLKEIEAKVKDAKTIKELRRVANDIFLVRNPPQPPHKKPPVAAINKILIELELLGDDVVTVESNRNYLDILHGDSDGNEKEYDDDEEESDEED